MLFTASAFVLAFLTQDQAGPVATTGKTAAAPVDRSAEPALKAFFAESGSLRGIHIAIEVYPRETGANRYDDDSSIDVWLGDGGRFRYQTSSNYWGGGSLFVSDGESLLSDDMSDDGSIHISKLKKTMHEVSDQETLLYALDGQPGFDALVDKDQPLKFQTSADPKDQAIELHSKKLGKIVLHYHDGSPIPTEIDTFQAPWWADDPAATSSDHPFTVEEIRIVSSGHVDQSLFSTRVAKGKKVVDERDKKN